MLPNVVLITDKSSMFGSILGGEAELVTRVAIAPIVFPAAR